jgi:N-acylglucosamine-6-phosphate 2-epimerase
VTHILKDLQGELVVSCQAAEESPLHPTEIIVALARAAQMGGAKAVRIEGVHNVAAVRNAVTVPVIGITKISHPNSDVYITPTVSDAQKLSHAGADIVAFDATLRPRPFSAADIVAEIHVAGKIAMADISTLEEARQAMASGADFVGTTLSGYTPYSPQVENPDFGLMRDLAAARIPFAAEGRIWEPAQARLALEYGATFVVVGSAITRPDVITRRFADAVAALRLDPEYNGEMK